jgi:tetratricopeptide (TPR) repeat protein
MWLSAHNRAMQSAWPGSSQEEEEDKTHQEQARQAHSSDMTAASYHSAAAGQREVLTVPVTRPYQFSTATAAAAESVEAGDDAFARGMELFEAGRVREALLAFEQEVQRDRDNSEAWRMLGACHAENDEDARAIDCLQRAIDADPFNLPALLSLGASYVNELNPSQALLCLQSWVEHNPKFFGVDVRPDEYSDGSLMDAVTQLMLAVAEQDPQDTEVPPPPSVWHGMILIIVRYCDWQVQVVLGVLYNVRHDYSAAVQCFHRALSTRPDDYSLWNKVRQAPDPPYDYLLPMSCVICV